MFSSVGSPVCGGSRHASLKRSGGLGIIPGFWMLAGVCAAAASAQTTSPAVRTVRRRHRDIVIPPIELTT
jgi:hypothetical protein